MKRFALRRQLLVPSVSTCRPSLLGMCISVDDEVRMINSVKLNQNSAIRRRYRFDTLLLFSPAPLLPTLESRRCIALCQSHRYLVALLVLPFVCLSYHSILLSNSETLTQKLQLKKRQLRRSNWKVLTGYRPKTSNASEPFPHTKSKPLPTARSLSGCFWSAERVLRSKPEPKLGGAQALLRADPASCPVVDCFAAVCLSAGLI